MASGVLEYKKRLICKYETAWAPRKLAPGAALAAKIFNVFAYSFEKIEFKRGGKQRKTAGKGPKWTLLILSTKGVQRADAVSN